MYLFVIYFTKMSESYYTRIASNYSVIEPERIWKEAIVAYLRNCPGMCLMVKIKIKKTSVISAGMSAKIATGHLLN
jgi:hypothetical protein